MRFKLLIADYSNNKHSKVSVNDVNVNVVLYRCKHELSDDDTITDKLNGNLIIRSITIGNYNLHSDALALLDSAYYDVVVLGGNSFENTYGNSNITICAHKSTTNRLYVDNIKVSDRVNITKRNQKQYIKQLENQNRECKLELMDEQSKYKNMVKHYETIIKQLENQK